MLRISSFSFLFTVLLLLSGSLHAQELNCRVKVIKDKITGVDPQVFTAMERSITEFVNNRKWTTDDFSPAEKIDCNILITLNAQVTGVEDAYSATISVQATRPVYNSGYTTPLINYVDRDFAFSFSQYSTLQFDDNRVAGANGLESNLTATLAYYVYVILGLDYDSFSLNGGAGFFKKAQNIVNNAPEQSKIVTGWKAFEDKKNRYWLADQLLSPRFQTFHTFWYNMHREGLDNMTRKPSEARQKIVSGFGALSQLQKDNPGSALLQFVFSTKVDEFLRVLAQMPREERTPYANTLAQTDYTNATKYNSLK